MELTHLGNTKTIYGDKYNPQLLEVFSNPQLEIRRARAQVPYTIRIVAPEFSCLCPKTGQPDYATIEVEYSPDEFCLESKSYKLYLFSFRNEGIFHEKCVNVIADDLFKILSPLWIQVEGKFAPRGGISFWPKVTLEK